MSHLTDVLKVKLGDRGTYKSANYSLDPQFSYGSNGPVSYTSYEQIVVEVPSSEVAAQLIDAVASPSTKLEGMGQNEEGKVLATISISSTAATASDAAKKTNELAKKTIDLFASRLGDTRKIKSSQSTVQAAPANSGIPVTPAVIGYSAHREIIVETTAIDLVGSLTDAAAQAGAKRVSGLSFKLHDPGKARDQAIAEATRDAQLTATSEATALGVKLGHLINSTVSVPVSPPPGGGSVTPAMSAVGPVGNPYSVPPSDLTVSAEVLLTYGVE